MLPKNFIDYHEINLNIFLVDIEQGFDTQSKKIFNWFIKNLIFYYLLLINWFSKK